MGWGNRQLGPTHANTVTCRNNLNGLRDRMAQKSAHPSAGDRPFPLNFLAHHQFIQTTRLIKLSIKSGYNRDS
jgi:hypothetical protein